MKMKNEIKVISTFLILNATLISIAIAVYVKKGIQFEKLTDFLLSWIKYTNTSVPWSLATRNTQWTEIILKSSKRVRSSTYLSHLWNVTLWSFASKRPCQWWGLWSLPDGTYRRQSIFRRSSWERSEMTRDTAQQCSRCPQEQRWRRRREPAADSRFGPGALRQQAPGWISTEVHLEKNPLSGQQFSFRPITKSDMSRRPSHCSAKEEKPNVALSIRVIRVTTPCNKLCSPCGARWYHDTKWMMPLQTTQILSIPSYRV